jgi:hypothetical protein
MGQRSVVTPVGGNQQSSVFVLYTVSNGGNQHSSVFVVDSISNSGNQQVSVCIGYR